MIVARVRSVPTARKSSSPSARRPCAIRSRPRAKRASAAITDPLSALESSGASASSAASSSPRSTSVLTSRPPFITRYIGGAGSLTAASAVRASPSAPSRSPQRNASQPWVARPTASRLLSPVARACAIEESRSGRSWAYRSAQRSENVVSENQVANENHGLPRDPPGALSPARSARVASSAPTSAGSLVRMEVNAATARGSSGGAG